MTLATDGLLGGRWTVDGGLEMLPAEGSLASPDAFPGIATWRGLRQPCVPARSLPALRPPMLFGALRLIN